MKPRSEIYWKMARPALCLAGFLAFLSPACASVTEWVQKMPIENPKELTEANAAVIKLGPAGIAEICRMLIPQGAGNDAPARFALNGLVKYANRPGAEPDRLMVSSVLIAALETSADNEVKAFLMSQIEMIAHDEAVGTLSRFLANPDLAEPATQALLAIHSPAAAAALNNALPAATGANLVTLIKALGELRCAEAAPRIRSFASSDDRETRLAAWFALANIGEPSAMEILTQATQSTSAYDRAKATSFYLLYAQRLAETGKKELAEKMCRSLVQTRATAGEANARSAALSTLVAIAGEGALPDLLAAVESENLAFRVAVLRLGARLPGTGVTSQWVDTMAKVAPPIRADIIVMLARRGDKAALPGLLEALKDPDQGVRLAAIDAACRLGRDDAVPDLLRVCETDRSGEIQATVAVLKRLPGGKVLKQAGEALPKASVMGRKALLELLSQRHAQDQVAAVFALTKDNDSTVRLAAIKALGNVAPEPDLPRVVDLMITTGDPAEQDAAQQAIVAIASRIDDRDQQAAPLLAVFDQTTGEKRCALLNALAELGGSRALQTVVADTQNSDAHIKDTALRALADWPDRSAVPALIEVLKGQNETVYQSLAMRGCLRLVEDSGWAPTRQVDIYQQAIQAAQRPEEKKLVLSALGRVHTIESLKVAAACLEDSTLQAEAVMAAAKIACPEPDKKTGLTGPEVNTVLKKAIEVCRDDKVRQTIGSYLETLSPAPAQ
ncbi:MAG: HEAT repeat domain-containing protein [Candidatus Omnitrophica bacterium]|nr:HEAT repeat domain-containing protein [Candidatus Omnitrophota bacterium]